EESLVALALYRLLRHVARPARRPAGLHLFPYTTLFRSRLGADLLVERAVPQDAPVLLLVLVAALAIRPDARWAPRAAPRRPGSRDRKSTRPNSSHGSKSYAVFCSKKEHAHGQRTATQQI